MNGRTVVVIATLAAAGVMSLACRRPAPGPPAVSMVGMTKYAYHANDGGPDMFAFMNPVRTRISSSPDQ